MTSTKNNDLWADIPEVTESLPRDFMKEQAAYLKKRTKGLITAEVITHSYVNTAIPHTSESTPSIFRQLFYLVVPRIKYRYALFSVSHPVLGYPAKFTSDYDEINAIANDEKEFLDILKQILSSDKTRRILAALLAQAKA